MRGFLSIGLAVIASVQRMPLHAQGMKGGSFDGAAMSVVTCGVAQTFHGGANDGASVATVPCGAAHVFRGSAFDGANVAVATCGAVRAIRGSAFDGAQMAVVTCGAPRAITGSGCNGDHMSIRVCVGEVYVTETCVTTALPVNLIELNARCEPGGVRIWWITGSELNSAFFSIERAMPQAVPIPMDEIEWRAVGTLGAAGHSQQLMAYSYFDDLGASVDIFNREGVLHRVAQVDLDGTTTYFPITSTLYPCDDLQSVTVYPVPARHSIHVRSSMPLEEIIISDALGNVVLAFGKGRDLATLDIARLSPGSYTLAGKHGSGVSYARFLVER